MSTKTASKASSIKSRTSKTSTLKSQQSNKSVTSNKTPPRTSEPVKTPSEPTRTMTSESHTSRKPDPIGLKVEKANGAVYVLLRFRSEHIGVMRNACIKERRIIQNFSFEGQVIGITDTVKPVFGTVNNTNEKFGIVMLRFKNAEAATRWFHSDSIFRQGDFPRPSGEIGMSIIPVQYIPPRLEKDSNGIRTFELVEMRNIGDNSRLQAEYIDQMANFMDACNLRHGVVATSDLSTPKSTWLLPGSYVVLHEYANQEEFDCLQEKCEYRDITDAGASLCTLSSILFTVNPKLCA